MPAHPLRNLLLPMLAAALSAGVAGCAQYDDAQACADLSGMLWPWRSMEAVTVTDTPTPSPLDTPIYGTRIIRVAGTLRRAADAEPLAAGFQCVHRGDLLQSFGWAEPNALARPELRLERGPVLPAVR